jgi:hypothetical protein
MGGHFFVIATSGLRPEHPLALMYEMHISQSCVASIKMASFPYRNLEPTIPSGILPDVFNCVNPGDILVGYDQIP